MFELPEELIAQHPTGERGTCRLMVLDRKTGVIDMAFFPDLPTYLHPEDALVLNDTRVINARLTGKRVPSGGTVELMLLERLEPCVWKVMVKPGKRSGAGNRFEFGKELEAVAVSSPTWGRAIVRFSSPGDTESVIQKVGTVPIPPYIRRAPEASDSLRYQTVFAREEGAVAAPTAGLHFTPELLSAIEAAGTSVRYVTLHVGPGTFQPLRREILAENEMEEERYSIREQVLGSLLETRRAGGRIVAVGTTVARTLESVNINSNADIQGRTSIFIHPPYSFRNVDVLLTNFHIPGSSLLSLVGSFAGLDLLMEAYAVAVENKYKFYSYGDAMLIV